MGVADFLRKEKEEPARDEDNGEKIGAEANEKKKDAAQVGPSGSHEVGFGVLRGLGVEGEVAGIEGKEGKQQEDAGTQDREGDHFLTEGGAGANRFGFGHRREGV